MITDLVSFSDNAAYRFRMLFNPIPNHKERGFDIMFGEDIQQLMGMPMKYTALYTFLILFPLMSLIFSGCQRIQQVIVPEKVTTHQTSTPTQWVLNFGFYAYFEPVSSSADPNPTSDKFNTHQGYEADLLTALEIMGDPGLSFARSAITEWHGIWLKAAEPEYDIIGGGITILDSRTKDASGTPRVTFTSGHIKFRQSLLVRSEDTEQLSDYASLAGGVRVGVLSGTTGEARLLELTGIVDADGVLLKGTRIETRHGTVITDGTAAYRITAAGASANLADRRYLYPPSEQMPEVIYLGDTLGESELLQALAKGSIDAIARGEIGNRDAAYTTSGTFVVTALDNQVEYGGFALAIEDAELVAWLDKRLNYLTDNSNIGYAEWLEDRRVFMTRAEMWNTTER